ncbi:hypothetical protein ABZ671_18970 [Micromonospora sp. NPDC006766]|uniref:hypothetical protein n=1 Tax=Micromonospora sp. NPDC006766 TaxID=3154778 RepID=UPI0033EE68D8
MTVTDQPGHVTRHPGGRPSKLTPEIADRIIKAVRLGNFLETAAKASGVHPATVYRWLQDADKPGSPRAKREFRDALSRARAEAEQRMVGAVIKDANGGYVTKRVTRVLRNGDKETEETIAGPNGRVALEFLSRAFPDRWARRSALEVTGAGGGPIQVSAERINGLADRVQAALTSAAVVDAEIVDDDEEEGAAA